MNRKRKKRGKFYVKQEVANEKNENRLCTVGPSTDKPGVLEAMLSSGMNVARFNFSHGNHADHGVRMAQVRQAAAAVVEPVALMLDTKGPEIRVGAFAAGKVLLKAGAPFILTARDVVGTEEIVSVTYPGLPQEVESRSDDSAVGRPGELACGEGGRA